MAGLVGDKNTSSWLHIHFYTNKVYVIQPAQQVVRGSRVVSGLWGAQQVVRGSWRTW